MGLDMYLTRKKYVRNWDHTPEEHRKNVEIFINGNKIETEDLTHIEYEAMYWRKANHIHDWFVKNCQDNEDDCRKSRVDIEQLKELSDLCAFAYKNKDKAEELLPTADGFFFGSVEYDEYYFDSLKETSDVLELLIKNHPKDEYIYESSW